jgi:hypothetical protein
MRDLPDLIGRAPRIPYGDASHALPVLSIYGVAALLGSRRDRRRQQLIETRLALGIEAGQIAVDADAFDDRVWDDGSLVEMISDRIDGQAAIFDASVKRGGLPPDLMDRATWTDPERYREAARIVGLTLTYADPQRGTPAPRADAGTTTETDASSSISSPASATPSS